MTAEEELQEDTHAYIPPFPVVGIGASAGGLEAFLALLRALPSTTGMAYVFVQHISPTHVSMLSEILGRDTSMPVQQVMQGMQLMADHVYVIAPGDTIRVQEGVFHVRPREPGKHHSVDDFLRSLAMDARHKAIGVVLSGGDADGTLGLQEIKTEGGITFAQDDSATHPGMPTSAIEAGCVDFVLSPEDIARELTLIARHPYIEDGAPEPVSDDPRGEESFERVLEILLEVTGVDFTHYRRNTLRRRLTRRMLLHKVENIQEYVKLLESSTVEVDALFSDVLINVTSFFRDEETYDELKRRVFPAILAEASRHEPVRIWTVGCSTGEEAFSLAMAFTEFMDEAKRTVPLQIFASDLNGAGIERARTAIYSKAIVNDIAPERLRRFFTGVDGSYRVAKPIRDLCVFAKHDVVKDPPFSHIDLLCCRNLLIYMEPRLQQRVVPLLHYSLKPNGFLWLGRSETIGAHRELFEIADAKHKIYKKRAVSSRVPLHSPRRHLASERAPAVASIPLPAIVDGSLMQKQADRILLAKFAPPSVLVDPELEVLQFRGDTGAYLAPASGRPSLSLLKMLREGLLIPVRTALDKARQEGIIVRSEDVHVKTFAGYRVIDLEVIPVREGTGKRTTYLLLFQERPLDPNAEPTHSDGVQAEEASELERSLLERELANTRQHLESVIEQQEAANEELQSANEEIQSANEELQSINEELETSKEEIQSSNEELATVNEELQHRNQELSLSNSDLVNLFSSVQMAIIILGPDLRIRRFTPMAERMLNLISSDVGRPIGDLKLQVDVPDLQELLVEVLEKVTVHEREVEDKHGRWYSLRIHPYRTLENKIDGAVLVLVDVDNLKRVEQSMRESEARFHFLADAAPVLMWMNGPTGCEFVNRAYLDYLGVTEPEVLGSGWLEFVHPSDRDAYLAAYEEASTLRRRFMRQLRFRRADGQYRWLESVGMPRFSGDGRFFGYVGASYDIHETKLAEESLRNADRTKNEFLAMLAHELRNPLAPLRNALDVLKNEKSETEVQTWAHDIMDRQIRIATRLVEDLLDVSRITQGKIQLRTEPVDIVRALSAAVDHMRRTFEHKQQTLHVDLPAERAMVDADPVRLDQIFNNLLSNAGKFTPTGGNVWVSLSLTAEHSAEISIRDDGAGMSSELLPNVFDLFVQGDRSLDRPDPGLGIGLTLVRRLVELHGGSIQARSGGSNQGSELVLRLPTLSQRVQPARPSSPPTEEAPPARILVVDDNVDTAESLSTLLSMKGHDVQMAHEGPLALAVAAEFEPDVVCLDIGLPGMTGFDVARELRARSKKQPVLIALSGYGREQDREAAREVGIDHYFTKPVDPSELHRLLRKRSR